MSLILRKFAVQAVDNSWLRVTDKEPYWDLEKHYRTIFDTEEEIRKLLSNWGFPGDYDIITVFVKY